MVFTLMLRQLLVFHARVTSFCLHTTHIPTYVCELCVCHTQVIVFGNTSTIHKYRGGFCNVVVPGVVSRCDHAASRQGNCVWYNSAIACLVILVKSAFSILMASLVVHMHAVC